MGRRVDQEQACGTKFQYLTPKAAEKVAKQMRRREKLVSSYRCPFCKKWHVGGIG